MKSYHLACIALLVLALPCSAATMTFTLDLDSGKLVVDSTMASRGFVRVWLNYIKSGVTTSSAGTGYGAPDVPEVTAMVVLPQHMRVTEFAAVAESAESVPGTYRLLPAQPPMPPRPIPFKEQAPPAFVPPIPEIYNSTEPYPGLSTSGWQEKPHEFNLAWVTVIPVQYIPIEGKLTFYHRFQVTLTFVPDTSGYVPGRVQPDEVVRKNIEESIRGLVLNPEDVSRFAPWGR
jgi:hypothetical protein